MKEISFRKILVGKHFSQIWFTLKKYF